MIKTLLASTAFIALSTPAFAQSQTPPPNPCETQSVYSDFDFWVGDWNVYAPNGQFAGVNRITKTDNDCLVRESWTSAAGNTGFSMNFYDVSAEAWRQIWVSRGLQIDYTGGLDEAGSMRLEGVVTYPGQGSSAPFRGAWTLQDNGEVLQEFHQQNPETGEWAGWFTGRYVPANTEPDNAAAAALWATYD